jgi:dTDP-4-amino-4,6-dideoxygalactose transaminase
MALDTRIYLSSPDVGLAEEEAVVRAVRSGWVAPLGPEVDAFEAEMASFVGASHAVALSSGTAALHLGLKAVGVQLGDSVITSTMTFVATANAISYAGARPVFVDSLDDGSPDPALIEEALKMENSAGRRVGAVIPVDIYGRLANYSELLPVAEKHGVPVVADAAEALGASHAGKRAGAWGDAAVLSFNGNKIMTTSGGGMLLTSDPDKARYVRYLATQAREPAVHYEHVELGYNYRMSSVCAALGRAQLARLPEMIGRRKERRVQYEEFFSDVDGVSMLPGDITEDNCWLSSILVDTAVAGWTPLELQAHLEELNIEARPLWKPMHLQPLYRESRFVGGDVAERLFTTGLALPSGSAMSGSDMDRVLHSLSSFLESR